ncbi:MAG TPA: hypothetical protein VFE61_25280, partial [Candidatus Sulfotelmatobacter sp.]|nr:hypothetical protein [Candidatus Sulfotelmatobacter sp.]
KQKALEGFQEAGACRGKLGQPGQRDAGKTSTSAKDRRKAHLDLGPPDPDFCWGDNTERFLYTHSHSP